MTIYLITTTCAMSFIITTAVLYRSVKQQASHMKTIAEAVYSQLQMLKFLCDAEASNLWKIRQDIYNWQNKWAQKEEYRAAQQAKTMVVHIEELIKIHTNIVKSHEDNERTNG